MVGGEGLRIFVRIWLRLIYLWMNWDVEKDYGDGNVVKKIVIRIVLYIRILSFKDSVMILKLVMLKF